MPSGELLEPEPEPKLNICCMPKLIETSDDGTERLRGSCSVALGLQ